MNNDQTLVCKDCSKDFIFSVRDQEFFASKNFNPPVRCSDCRAIVKQRKMEQGGDRGGYHPDRGGGGGRNRY